MKTSPASSITLPKTDLTSAVDQENTGVVVRQFVATTRLSLRRMISSKVFWGSVGMAALPVALGLCILILVLIHGGTAADGMWISLDGYDALNDVFAGAFLHFALFFSAVSFGTSALRGELDPPRWDDDGRAAA